MRFTDPTPLSGYDNSQLTSVQAIPLTKSDIPSVTATAVDEPLTASNVAPVSHKEAVKYVNQLNYQTLKEAQIAYKNLGGHVITDNKTNKAMVPLNEAINKLTLLNQYLNDINSLNSKAPIAEENRKIYNDFIKANNPNFKTEIKNKPTFKKQLLALKNII